jgi:hypothetical protein
MNSTTGFWSRRGAACIAALALAPLCGAQSITQSKSADTKGSPGPGSLNTGGTETTHRYNRLVFPYGVQSFDDMRVGDLISEIPGWEFKGDPGFDAFVANDGPGEKRPGSKSRRWMCVEDQGTGMNEGFHTAPIQAPSPWDYAWNFHMRIEQAPTLGGEMPAIVIQHTVGGSFQDAWGIELTDLGANLFLTGNFGTPDSTALFDLADETAVGEWIHVRVVASLEWNRLEAYVNDHLVAVLAINPRASTDVTLQRFAYHGEGLGNTSTVLFDDIGIAFSSAVCKDSIFVGFENDDAGALVNGQDISTPPEFGNAISISSAGANAGAAIFDSTPTGPNDPSQDPDLLVNLGNLLILQSDDAAAQGVAGIFDSPNDDEDGGTLSFLFTRQHQPLSIDLVDIDEQADESAEVVLTDCSGNTRTYTVPTDWTGDITTAGPGVGTLDLTTLAPQPGWMSIATAADVGPYDPNRVVAMDVTFGSSGALDNYFACLPCVEIDFTNEDDGVTALGNGQIITTPPEFGIEVSLSSSAPADPNEGNEGLAIFDSTPGGDNDPSQDLDLLVGLGNLLILQNDSPNNPDPVGDFFPRANDDEDGGCIRFDFPGPVEARNIDLIDVDTDGAITVVLTDSAFETRTFSIPGGWTSDVSSDGPPGFGTLDMTSLADQPGFASTATAVESANFDANDVRSLEVFLSGSGALDNLCFCPQSQNCP